VIRDFATANSPELRSRVEAHLASPDRQPVGLRPASTVMLVRDGSTGIEVFMLQRVATMEFAPSTMVFPGGGVDGRDHADQLPWAGPDSLEWALRLGSDKAGARMLVVAAVREVFEECGVLLASVTPGGPLFDVSGESWQAARQGLVARELSLCELLIERGLVLRSDLLRAHAHWVTPEFHSKRYDTRFFVARMPPAQTADDKSTEADVAGWFAPADVLAAYEAGEAILLPPTVVCLQDLARFSTAAACFDHTPVIRTVEPTLQTLEDGSVVVRVDLNGRPQEHYLDDD